MRDLASPGEGGTPRNDEADLGRREGLFIADLNIENAGLENDRHREAIFADNEAIVKQEEEVDFDF